MHRWLVGVPEHDLFQGTSHRDCTQFEGLPDLPAEPRRRGAPRDPDDDPFVPDERAVALDVTIPLRFVEPVLGAFVLDRDPRTDICHVRVDRGGETRQPHCGCHLGLGQPRSDDREPCPRLSRRPDTGARSRQGLERSAPPNAMEIADL